MSPLALFAILAAFTGGLSVALSAESGATQLQPLAALNAAADTQTICGSMPPAGWVTVSINGYCAKNGITSYIGRTIRRVDNLAPGASVVICGEGAPGGWATTAISSTYCAKLGTSSYIARTIRKVEGLAAGTALTICGEGAPGGWATTAISNTYCAKLGTSSYIARTIRKVDGMPVGSILIVCGQGAPSGWITTAISGSYCAQLGSSYYIARTVRLIAGSAVGTQLAICGDAVPSGWVSVTVTPSCARLGSTTYTGRTIKKVSATGLSHGEDRGKPASETAPASITSTGGSRSKTASDFDGDGKADLVAVGDTEITWRASSDGKVSRIAIDKGARPVFADFNGDGLTDVALFHSSQDLPDVAEFVILDTATGDSQVIEFGAPGDVPLAADFDGDGAADLAVFRAGSPAAAQRATFLYRPANGGAANVELELGELGDVPAAADFDGDGLADVAVFRPQAGVWLIRHSETEAVIQVALSATEAAGLAADFDGDGKADPGAYKAGSWMIHGSVTPFRTFELGDPRAVAVPADYDGDGKADLAVFHDGLWILRFSGSGETVEIRFRASN